MDPVKPGDTEKILESYLNEAKRLFATRDGYERWEPLYVSVPTKIGAHIEKIRSRKDREYFYNLNLITDDDIHGGFARCVASQRAYGHMFRNRETGEKINARDKGRWGHPRAYLWNVRRKIKEEMGICKNPIMLTLSVSPKIVERRLPGNTNMVPIAWFIFHLGEFLSQFGQRLWKYQKKEKIPWSFVAWVLEIGESGWPNIHWIFEGPWIGDIGDIAKLWPWSEPQGVDISDVAKLRKRHPEKKYTPLYLVNYITKYVTKGTDAFVGGKVHRSWAWVYFAGLRMFAIRNSILQKGPKTPGKWECAGRVYLKDGIEYPFRRSSKAYTEEPEP
ncbi:MAG: hypothetical protein ABSC55_22040 [Syntrophorhabdales bacterium]|jgi:hypothetical protein